MNIPLDTGPECTECRGSSRVTPTQLRVKVSQLDDLFSGSPPCGCLIRLSTLACPLPSPPRPSSKPAPKITCGSAPVPLLAVFGIGFVPSCPVYRHLLSRGVRAQLQRHTDKQVGRKDPRRGFDTANLQAACRIGKLAAWAGVTFLVA